MMKNKIEKEYEIQSTIRNIRSVFAFLITSCTTILDNTSETNLIGTQVPKANTRRKYDGNYRSK